MQAGKLDKEHLWLPARIKYTVLAEVRTNLLVRDWAIHSSSHWNRNESSGKWLWTILRDSLSHSGIHLQQQIPHCQGNLQKKKKSTGKPCWVRPSSPVLCISRERSSFLTIYILLILLQVPQLLGWSLFGVRPWLFHYLHFMDLNKCPLIFAFPFWPHWCNLPSQPLVSKDSDTKSLWCKKVVLCVCFKPISASFNVYFLF